MQLTPLTGPRGQSVAVGLTIVVAAAIWAGIISPVQAWFSERAELLQRQQAIAHRMTLLVDTLPTLRRKAAAANSAGNGTGDNTDNAASLLSGDSDALAAASLQQRIDDFAAKAGVRIGSEEILPAQPEGALRSVTVRVTVTAPFQALVTWLTSLAQAETPMIADELQLRGSAGTTAKDRPVDASLTVTAYRAPNGGVHEGAR